VTGRNRGGAGGEAVAIVDRLEALKAPVATLAPGLMLCATIAAAASFLSDHYGGPAMLFALLIGIAFNFVMEEGRAKAGVEFASRFVLRLGVGLLGIRITLQEIAAFGWQTPAVVAGLMALTIGTGFVAARIFGRQWRFALMTGGAVAICGASATLAIAAVIPHNDKTERNVLFTVVAVTTLSTIAMVIYPILFAALGFEDREIGFLIGATIHDVAQVVGAGYSVSDTAGDAATVVKLLRVAFLPVVLMAVVLVLRAQGQGGGGRVPLMPWFMGVFILLSVTGSLIALPEAVTGPIEVASRAMLVTAIAALGVKTSLKAILSVGSGHIWVVTVETLVLLAAAIAAFELFLSVG
jgi:uncharacterized integral membrane protein (TIGR00698 family)